MSEPTTKKFGSGERTIPHHTEKAPKYYPAEDISKPKTVRIPITLNCADWIVGGWTMRELAIVTFGVFPHNGQNPHTGRN
jgi:hypothetical protein